MMTMTDPERLETILSRYAGVAADLIPVLPPSGVHGGAGGADRGI